MLSFFLLYLDGNEGYLHYTFHKLTFRFHLKISFQLTSAVLNVNIMVLYAPRVAAC